MRFPGAWWSLARGGVAAVLISVIVAGPTAASHVPFTPSVVARSAAQMPFLPDVAAYGTNVVTAWQQPAVGSDPGSVWVRQKVGSTWGAPVRLRKLSTMQARTIRLFSTPTKHYAVWSEDVAGGGSRIFLSSATFGGPWTAAVQVSSNGGASRAHYPRIVVSGSVSVVVYGIAPLDQGPFAGVARSRIGTGAWTSLVLPGLAERGVSLAVSSTRVLVAWTPQSGQVLVRRGTIGGGGTSFSWVTGILTIASGTNPIVLLSGTRAVVLYEDVRFIYRRLSSTSGNTWGAPAKILTIQQAVWDAGYAHYMDDGAMSGNRVVVTGNSLKDAPGSFRLTSANFGTSWVAESASLETNDQRQVAYQTVGGVPRLTETWLRVQGQFPPYALRYQQQT